MSIYKAFDRFLAAETWHPHHPCDDERFYLALSMVIDDPSFRADHMSEYFLEQTGANDKPEDHPFYEAATRREIEAETIQDYLQTIAKN